MKTNIANNNANLIISNPHGNFTTSRDKLILLSRYNIIGRIVKWIQNIRGGVDSNVNEVAGRTLNGLTDLDLRRELCKTMNKTPQFKKTFKTFVLVSHLPQPTFSFNFLQFKPFSPFPTFTGPISNRPLESPLPNIYT